VNSTTAEPLRVFISYRHADHGILDAIRDHLGWLENDARIRIFDDQAIVAGEDWDARIKAELDAADVIILVVTAKFMRSKYCTKVELKNALQRRSKKGTLIIPIIAETCDWVAMPISALAALPKDKANNLKPLNKWGRDRDVALTQIAQHVRLHTERLLSDKTRPKGRRSSRSSAPRKGMPTPAIEAGVDQPPPYQRRGPEPGTQPRVVTPSSLAQTVSLESLYWAIEHLRNYGDTDLFPIPFEFAFLANHWSSIRTRLAGLDLYAYKWGRSRKTLIHKDELIFRSATQLDPLDTLLITAVIYQFGPVIEARRLPYADRVVFSYRFDPSSDGRLYSSANYWATFWQTSIQNAEELSFTLATDISDFYN
jgi:hypothetical protein